MGDSDDEFRRRGRDKFMNERNDYQRRDFIGDRRSYGQPRDYVRGQQQIKPRDFSPPTKRMRRDWDESYEGVPTSRRVGDELAQQLPTPNTSQIPQQQQSNLFGRPSTLMSFKQFLAQQDDSISDEDAMQKYQDYKLEYKRQQLHAFFLQHKDEEWFRTKYHPVDSEKRKEEHLASIRRRLTAYQALSNKGWIERSRLDVDNGRNILKLLDGVVVKLEGGTDDELTTLEKLDELMDDSYDTVTEQRERSESKKLETDDKSDIKEKNDDISDNESIHSEKSKSSAPPSVGKMDDQLDKKEEGENDDDMNVASLQAKRKKVDSTASDITLPNRMILHKTSSIFLRNLSPVITRADIETICKRFPGFLRIAFAEPMPDHKFYRRGWVTFRRDVNIKEICWTLNSIRLKECDLAPSVNRDLTRRIRACDGCLSHKPVAQADLRLAAKLVQIYDKKRNLWQTDFTNKAISEADDQLDTENDAKQPAVIEEPPNLDSSAEFDVSSRNPLLKNITDHLIEEASAEEEELLGLSGQGGADQDQKILFERDEALLKVLDRILLYLRLVHSVDFYNHGEYPFEDDMPNRCGLIHVRGPLPMAQFGTDDHQRPLISTVYVNDYMKSFETSLSPLFNLQARISDEEAEKLGKKDPEKEVDAFITANSQELAKDKWLCPLSGKKFKGPEFIRKHIQNKHADKLDEVRAEVIYFNNYLYDPKRFSPFESARSQQYLQNQHAYGNGTVSSDHQSQQHQELRPSRTSFERRQQQEDYVSQSRPSQQDAGGYGRAPVVGGGGGSYYRNQQSDYGAYSRRDHYQRRDYSSGYGSQGGGGRSQQSSRHYQASEGRRGDPRVPVAYTDLDAPEDVY